MRCLAGRYETPFHLNIGQAKIKFHQFPKRLPMAFHQLLITLRRPSPSAQSARLFQILFVRAPRLDDECTTGNSRHINNSRSSKQCVTAEEKANPLLGDFIVCCKAVIKIDLMGHASCPNDGLCPPMNIRVSSCELRNQGTDNYQTTHQACSSKHYFSISLRFRPFSSPLWYRQALRAAEPINEVWLVYEDTWH